MAAPKRKLNDVGQVIDEMIRSVPGGVPEWLERAVRPPTAVQIDDGRSRRPDGVGIEVYTPEGIIRRNPLAN